MQFTGPPTPRFFTLVVLLTAALVLPRTSQASDHAYLLYHQWQSYDWQGDMPAADDVSRVQRGLGWRRQFPAGSFGLDYDYQALRIRTGDPAHNGHLHRITLGGDRQLGLYRVEARAGLAGTSNMFKEQAFHREVMNGRVAIFRALNESTNLSLGIGGDHRFGSFRWVPRLRWELMNNSGRWLIDLPVRLRWQGHHNRWVFRMERMGDRWATLDKTQQVESALYMREWRTELTYRIRAGDERWPAVILGIGASIETRVRYRDFEEGTLDLRLGDAFFGSIRLSW